MNALVIVDVQNDFITGSLGTMEAQDMLPRLIKKARGFDGIVFMTRDTHGPDYLQTQEGRMLPVLHCIKDTEGWQFPPELDVLRESRNAVVYEKPCFGSSRLVEELVQLYTAGTLESVELAGFCTDICVISNALMIKAALPELPVYADAACCAGVTPQKHEAALDVMESCQVIVRRGSHDAV